MNKKKINHYVNKLANAFLKGKIISPQFKDFKNGKLKIISFYAKKARGLMTRYLIENELIFSAKIIDNRK